MNTETHYLGKPCKHGHLTDCGKHSVRLRTNRHCIGCTARHRVEVRSRNHARSAELKTTTYRGAACVNGHIDSDGSTLRYTRSNTCVVCDKAWSKRSQRNSPHKARFRAKAGTARRQGIEFDLEFDDIIWPELCPVLGIRLDYSYGTKGGHAKKTSPSFDRIDPTKGYVKGNVIIVSLKANAIKQDASAEEVLRVGQFYQSLLDKPLV